MIQPTRLERFLGRLVAPRMGLWLYVSLALLAAVWLFAPHMVKVVAFKLTIITLAAFVGDKIARAMEGKNLRPHEFRELAKVAPTDRAEILFRLGDGVLYRRAIVIGACVIAAALGG